MRKKHWTVTISLNIDFFFSSMPKTGFFFYFHAFGFKRLKGKIEKEKRVEKDFQERLNTGSMSIVFGFSILDLKQMSCGHRAKEISVVYQFSD